MKVTVQHGLRANAAIRLRQERRTALLISDMAGVSVDTVVHYRRRASRTASGQAVLLDMKQRAQSKNATAKK